MKPVLKLNQQHNINVSKKKTLAFIELNLACDMVLECIHSINLPNKIKKSVNNTLIPFYQNQIDKVFNNSPMSEAQFRLLMSREIQTRIKTALDLAKIKK